MGNPVDAITGGISDGLGSPATSKTSANTRVQTASGAIGIQTDVPSFAAPTTTGVWTLGALRTKINGIPVITTTAIGIGIAPSLASGTSGPLQLTQSDSRVKAL